MPGLNRTGPEGEGSRTGRGMGKCNPDSKSNGPDTTSEDVQNERGFRRGSGRGRGQGQGQGRNRFSGRGRGLGRNR